MKSLIIPILLAALLISGCQRADIITTTDIICNFDDSSSAHPKDAAFSAIMDKYLKLGLPGISILIEDKSGTWVKAGGYADIAEGVKLTPCHLSKVASITKMFTGSLCMRLQELNYLNIDDPLSKYIDKKILDKIDNADGKTIRQALNHTTGIFDLITSSDFYLAVLNNPNKVWKPLELLEFVYGQKGYDLEKYPAFYSNTNTVLVHMCIEKATGRNANDLLKEHILTPLGLKSTLYQGHDPIPSDAAQGYFDLHSNNTISNVSNFITGSGNGFGGIYSDVFDLQTFIRALLIEKTLLGQQSLDEMLQFVREDDDYYTGLGVVKKYIEKQHYGIGHTGKDLGYSANLFWFPDIDAIMIFFVNYGTNGESNLKQVFLDFESELVDAIVN